jgi:hypothetical protein
MDQISDMETLNWNCPYCGHAATLRDEDIVIRDSLLQIKNSIGYRCFTNMFIVCPNPDCKRFTLTAALKKLSPYWISMGLV